MTMALHRVHPKTAPTGNHPAAPEPRASSDDASPHDTSPHGLGPHDASPHGLGPHDAGPQGREPRGNALWLPRSPCGPWCLPPLPATATASAPTVVLRLVATVSASALLLLALPVLICASADTARRVARGLARTLLAAVGVRLHRCGPPVPDGALLVANHISWLDIPAVLAIVAARPVAKREVLRWPGIGAAAAAIGAIAIDRHRPRRLPATVSAAASALRRGASVLVFPEATTWCGTASGAFRPALFQAAIDADAPVVPVRLCYTQPGRDGRAVATTVPAFVGSQSLLASLIRVLTARDLVISVMPQPAVRASTRTGLATLAKVAIDQRRT